MSKLFKKAEKKQRRLRMAIFGASGSGKTYSALAIASGIGGSIALIDTENSAALYADTFDFDLAPLEKPTIDNLLAYMEEAADYNVLIIDSFSHAWKELLNEMSKLAETKYRGNTHAAWAKGTPQQEKLIRAILGFKGHLIVCMRSKTEWLIEKDERTGKSKPVRVGLAPVQGKDIEYEFDLLMEMSPNHVASIIKDRTGKYQDVLIDKPGKDFGSDLIKWLMSGKKEKPVQKTKPVITEEILAKIMASVNKADDAMLDKIETRMKKYQVDDKYKDLLKMISEKREFNTKENK